MAVSLTGDQIRDSYGGVLHIQNAEDIENDNTGYDIANRPDSIYKVYDGNGVDIPITFVNGALVVDTIEVSNITITNAPPALPARKTVVYETPNNVPANGSAFYLLDLGYSAVSLRKLSSSTACVVRLYPSESLSNLDTRITIPSLTELPPPDCGLINQIDTSANLTVNVSGQSVGMTDDYSGNFGLIITNLTGMAVPISLVFDFLALEAPMESPPIMTS